MLFLGLKSPRIRMVCSSQWLAARHLFQVLAVPASLALQFDPFGENNTWSSLVLRRGWAVARQQILDAKGSRPLCSFSRGMCIVPYELKPCHVTQMQTHCEAGEDFASGSIEEI